MDKFKNGQNRLKLKYTLLFLGLMAAPLIFSWVTGRSFINTGDAADGGYPGLVYVGNVIRSIPYQLIHDHRLPTYDFLLGVGGNIMETMSAFGDPFNWISVLFPGELSVLGYTACVFLRLYVGGLGFVIWTERKRLYKGALVGALTYVFCTYAMNTGIHFSNYLTAFAMFPFVAAGVDDLIERNRKFSGVLLLGITVTLLSGFAMLYMDTVFFAVYLVIRSLYNRESGKFDRRNWILVWRNFWQCLKHYLLGVGIASPFFLQDLYGHLLSSRSEINPGDVLRLFDASTLVRNAIGFISNVYYTDGVGIGILAFLTVLMFVFSRKHRDLRWVLVLMVAGHFVLGFHVLMNCFVYAPYVVGRWHFILYFCLSMALTIGLEEWRGRETLNRRNRILLMAVSTACYLGCVVFPAMKIGLDNPGRVFCFAVASVSWLVSLGALFLKPEERTRMIAAACVVVAAANAYPTLLARDIFVDADIYNRTKNSELAAWGERDRQSGALRTDLNDPVRMASLITGTPGTRSYYSVQNDGYYSFLRDMASSASLYGGNVNMGSLDGRKSLEMLLSVGTYADDQNNTIIHHNDGMILPIGFAYDSYMRNEDALKLDPLDRSHLVMKTVYLEEDPGTQVRRETADPEQHNWESIPVEVDCSAVGRSEDGWTDIRGGAEILVRFPEGAIVNDEKTEYYLYFSSIESVDWLSMIEFSGLKSIRFTPAGEAANQRGEYLVKLAVNDEVIEKGYIELSPWDGRYRFGKIELRKLDISGYEEDYRKLARHALRNVEMTPDRITGEISCEGDSILFTSILFDERWTCLVDGVPARLHKADSGFLAAEIGSGDHQVVLEYRTNLGWIALLIGAVSMGVAVLWIRADRKRRSLESRTVG